MPPASQPSERPNVRTELSAQERAFESTASRGPLVLDPRDRRIEGVVR